MCERHPHLEVTHYCQLHNWLICDDCFLSDEHVLHKERHVKPVKNDEIEKQIAKANDHINLL